MKAPSIKHKSKRVQKKLYIGDFTILGFEVSGKFINEDEDQINNFFDELIEFLETRNIGFGGGYTIKAFDGFISSAEQYLSATEDDRQATEDWLKSQDKITEVSVDALVDANYEM